LYTRFQDIQDIWETFSKGPLAHVRNTWCSLIALRVACDYEFKCEKMRAETP